MLGEEYDECRLLERLVALVTGLVSWRIRGVPIADPLFDSRSGATAVCKAMILARACSRAAATTDILSGKSLSLTIDGP